MPACVSSYAIRGDSVSVDMQSGVHLESTEPLWFNRSNAQRVLYRLYLLSWVLLNAITWTVMSN